MRRMTWLETFARPHVKDPLHAVYWTEVAATTEGRHQFLTPTTVAAAAAAAAVATDGPAQAANVEEGAGLVCGVNHGADNAPPAKTVKIGAQNGVKIGAYNVEAGRLGLPLNVIPPVAETDDGNNTAAPAPAVPVADAALVPPHGPAAPARAHAGASSKRAAPTTPAPPQNKTTRLDTSVGRCRLTVSKPVLKAPMVSALETRMAFNVCFQFQLSPLHLGGRSCWRDGWRGD